VRMEKFDQNKNGYLEVDEVRKMTKMMDHSSGKKFEESELQVEFARMDANMDGRVDFDELVDYFTRKMKASGRYLEA
jgi:Ca2+-binding EF-hand superfamily protein